MIDKVPVQFAEPGLFHLFQVGNVFVLSLACPLH